MNSVARPFRGENALGAKDRCRGKTDDVWFVEAIPVLLIFEEQSSIKMLMVLHDICLAEAELKRWIEAEMIRQA
jgi:hypothetical protein